MLSPPEEVHLSHMQGWTFLPHEPTLAYLLLPPGPNSVLWIRTTAWKVHGSHGKSTFPGAVTPENLYPPSHLLTYLPAYRLPRHRWAALAPGQGAVLKARTIKGGVL